MGAKCGCLLEKFPKKYQIPVTFENGSKGYIMVSETEWKRIKEKIQEKLEIREVFE